MPSLYVAVYGSLKRNHYNHHYLNGAVFMGRFVTARGFALLDLGDYPGMIKSGERRVMVEVYRVSPAALIRLDKLESVPRVYQRVKIRIKGFGWAYSYLLAHRFVCSLGAVHSLHRASGCW